MDTLPTEIIFALINAETYKNLAQTCKLFNNISEDWLLANYQTIFRHWRVQRNIRKHICELRPISNNLRSLLTIKLHSSYDFDHLRLIIEFHHNSIKEYTFVEGRYGYDSRLDAYFNGGDFHIIINGNKYREDMISRYIHICFDNNITPYPNLIADLKDKCYEFYREKKFENSRYLVVWSYLCEDRKSIVKDFLQYYDENYEDSQDLDSPPIEYIKSCMVDIFSKEDDTFEYMLDMCIGYTRFTRVQQEDT